VGPEARPDSEAGPVARAIASVAERSSGAGHWRDPDVANAIVFARAGTTMKAMVGRPAARRSRLRRKHWPSVCRSQRLLCRYGSRRVQGADMSVTEAKAIRLHLSATARAPFHKELMARRSGRYSPISARVVGCLPTRDAQLRLGSRVTAKS
jgi:hypothetical protein